MSTFVKRYNPHRHADWNYGGSKWKLSRSKIELYLECPRCFYLDNKLGTKRPGFPSFTLNIAVDELFKKEFDLYRAKQEPHPIITAYNLKAVPYQHRDLDEWRDPFVGLQYRHTATGLMISGGVDDIWVNPDGELIVVDYKATSKTDSIATLADSSWEDSYRRQIGVYQWLLEQLGFTVAQTGYFVYANARQDVAEFGDQLLFETTLVPCEGDTTWIDETITAIKGCLDDDNYPASGPNCEFCAYREACGKKLQSIHARNKQKKAE